MTSLILVFNGFDYFENLRQVISSIGPRPAHLVISRFVFTSPLSTRIKQAASLFSLLELFVQFTTFDTLIFFDSKQ